MLCERLTRAAQLEPRSATAEEVDSESFKIRFKRFYPNVQTLLRYVRIFAIANPSVCRL